MAMLLEISEQIGEGLYSTKLSNPFVFSLLLLLFFFLVYKITRSGIKPRLPPSPPKLPIIGNIHQLRKLPHRSLRTLSEKYGPVMMLQIGQIPTLVISSAEAAKDLMKTHDSAFSGRPQMTTANIAFYGCRNVGFSPCGEYWRQAKKIYAVELLSNKMVQSFQFVREEETEILNDRIRRACLSGASINLSTMLFGITNDIVLRCALGQKAEEDGGNNRFGEISRRVLEQFTDFSFGDVFPSLRLMDSLTGMVPRFKANFKEVDAFLDQVIEENRKPKNDDKQHHREKDFVNILLKLQKDGFSDIQLSEDDIKALLMETFLAGTDTTGTTMEWLMAELMNNQNAMKMAQEEVRRIVGKKSKVEASDIDRMRYLKCVVKESLRLHPPVPLLVPRETTACVEFGGYHVPPKTRVLVNAFAIQRDPKFWDRPDEFIPERFMNNPVDFRGQDFEFIPFGAGRRRCPGITFAMASAEFVIANLLHWFDWKLPSGAIGEDFDMNEIDGLAIHKKIELRLVPTLYTP